ncbi:MAG: DUF3419 family protein [Planctomycetes bacterium]|nr:DUF3419 family protein [Planctomycetota bacterium]
MFQDINWLEEAAALPLAFALVREDALLDLDVVNAVGRGERVLMVASGGCTAAALATLPNVAHLHLVDPNPAQLALCRLKLHLLATNRPEERLAVLGHSSVRGKRGRRGVLAGLLESLELPEDVFGPPDLVAALGPDHCGRYERLFARLREILLPWKDQLTELLQLGDPAEQARRVDPATPLGRALDEAYDDVLALPNLVRLFGEGATQNPVEPFARHFARRTRAILATLPAADNPYLWLMLAGRLPDGVSLPWITEEPPEQLPEVVCTRGLMADVLAGVPAGERYHVIHLSNILDWLTPAEARHTLELAWRALRYGGRVFIRQLNSTLNIRDLGEGFRWDEDESEAMHRRDRSFFYRTLHLGVKE